MSNVNFNFEKPQTTPPSYNFNFGAEPVIFNLLFGSNNNFISIWADPGSSLSAHTIYIGREEDLTIITKKEDPVIKDYFSKTVAGSTGETLTDNTQTDTVVFNRAT